MHYIFRTIFFCLLLILKVDGCAAIYVGIGKIEITPPLGTPSAGYADRKGEGMIGAHDPLFATALFIDNEEKKIFICSVDHLGLPYDMTQEIRLRLQKHPELAHCELYITSTHTHSGGGAYLNIPVLGETLAGPYDPKIVERTITKTTEALLSAYNQSTPAKIGIGYGKAPALHSYRALWPQKALPPSDVTVIKITTLHDTPLAVLYNYAIHPTVLTGQNRLFSADFVGYARTYLESFIGPGLESLFVNGAQGDLLPEIFNKEDRFVSCEILGKALAEIVKIIWDKTPTQDSLHIATEKLPYTFTPQATPFGLTFPIKLYHTEMNILVLDHAHAFLTIPGELSCLYDLSVQKTGKELGFAHVSIIGLCNDAHGYIITPEAWRHKTYESGLSFGGEDYGEKTFLRAQTLLQTHAPLKE
jgi:hypothetical protein